MREISSGSRVSPVKRNVANARVGSSELVIDIPERVAVLIRDHAVIIYDNAVRSTKIARRLNLMKRLSELLACNAEPVTDVFGRIFWAIPNSTRHNRSYSSR